MNLLTAEEISICMNHCTLLDGIINENQTQKDVFSKKVRNISNKINLLSEHSTFIEEIFKGFLVRRRSGFEKEVQNLDNIIDKLKGKLDLYRECLEFFNNEKATAKDVHKILIGLSQCFIMAEKVPRIVPSEIWKIKVSLDERNGMPISNRDKAMIEFIKGN